MSLSLLLICTNIKLNTTDDPADMQSVELAGLRKSKKK